MALQSPGDVQGSELSGMRSTCLLGFNEPLVLFSDNLLVVLGRNNPSFYTVKGRPLYVHLNGLAIVLLK